MSHWYDSTPKKSRRKRDSNRGSSSLEADALPLGQRGGKDREGEPYKVHRRLDLEKTERVSLTKYTEERLRKDREGEPYKVHRRLDLEKTERVSLTKYTDGWI